MIFVSERTESLCVRPVSFIDDEYTDHYIREMVLMSERDVPRGTINVERIETSLLEEWKRQLIHRILKKVCTFSTTSEGA